MPVSKEEKYLIKENDELLRRIPRVPSHLKNNKVTSAAFKTKPDEDGLSVDILKLTTLEKTIPNKVTHAGAIIFAKLPMSLGYKCEHHPTEQNYAHALIVGNTRPIARKLAENCTLI